MDAKQWFGSLDDHSKEKLILNFYSCMKSVASENEKIYIDRIARLEQRSDDISAIRELISSELNVTSNVYETLSKHFKKAPIRKIPEGIHIELNKIRVLIQSGVSPEEFRKCVIQKINADHIDCGIFLGPHSDTDIQTLNTQRGQGVVMYSPKNPSKLIVAISLLTQFLKSEHLRNNSFGKSIYKMQCVSEEFCNIRRNIQERKKLIKSLHSIIDKEEHLIMEEEEICSRIVNEINRSYDTLDNTSKEKMLIDIYNEVLCNKGSVNLSDYKTACTKVGISYRNIYKFGGIKGIKKLVNNV